VGLLFVAFIRRTRKRASFALPQVFAHTRKENGIAKNVVVQHFVFMERKKQCVRSGVVDDHCVSTINDDVFVFFVMEEVYAYIKNPVHTALFVAVGACVNTKESSRFVFLVMDRKFAFTKRFAAVVGNVVEVGFVNTKQSNTIAKNVMVRVFVITIKLKIIVWNVEDPKFAHIKKKNIRVACVSLILKTFVVIVNSLVFLEADTSLIAFPVIVFLIQTLRYFVDPSLKKTFLRNGYQHNTQRLLSITTKLLQVRVRINVQTGTTI